MKGSKTRLYLIRDMEVVIVFKDKDLFFLI
jgi:hypothetical protein